MQITSILITLYERRPLAMSLGITFQICWLKFVCTQMPQKNLLLLSKRGWSRQDCQVSPFVILS